MSSPAVPLPMFPLGTVLFPHAVLPLHVFEERYRGLVRDCLQEGHEFGVVLIERGSEVGGGDSRFSIGTVARIREAAPYPDGRWVLATYGTGRIRVHTWLPDDPYPVALVEDVHDARLSDISLRAVEDATRLVRRALALKAELGEPASSPQFELNDDVHVAAWQLAARAPLNPLDQQRLLETDDPAERLTLLAGMAQDAGDLLAYRLSG